MIMNYYIVLFIPYTQMCENHDMLIFFDKPSIRMMRCIQIVK